jgi:hypothetical protein
MVGLILLSLLIAQQYGFTFLIIQQGFWSIAYCLKPHTLIVFSAFGIVYYLLLGACDRRSLKAVALMVLGFILQDMAYMFFYCPMYGTSAVLRNGWLFYGVLFILKDAGDDVNTRRLFYTSLLSVGVLFIYLKTGYINLDMTLPSFAVVDSLLKIIPLACFIPCFTKLPKID